MAPNVGLLLLLFPSFPTLAEAESEIGVADWIDPDSGLPAEGQAPTHLERE